MRNAPVYWKNEENEIRRSGKDAIDVALEKDAKCIMKSFDKKISMPNHMKNKSISKKDKMM